MSYRNRIAELSARVVDTAHASHVRIVTAESCTAGSLATLIADTPGSGDVLLGGFVTYAKQCKTDVLDISGELLERHSAVSAEVAEAMADGALRRCASADVAIAVTCVGGPKPDEDGNPVGLTYLAVKRRAGEAVVRKLSIEGESAGHIRNEVLRQALQLLLQAVTEDARQL